MSLEPQHDVAINLRASTLSKLGYLEFGTPVPREPRWSWSFPRCSPGWIWEALGRPGPSWTIGTKCWNTGSFFSDGEINCTCTRIDCIEEFACEMLAALILMPEDAFSYDYARLTEELGLIPKVEEALASLYVVEREAVAFRLALEGFPRDILDMLRAWE